MSTTQRVSILCFLTLVVIAAIFLSPRISHATITAGPMTGYAWSDTIGWIDLNCSNSGECATDPFGLSVDASGNVTGYAWSDNVGWISANPSDLAGCPSGTCSAKIVAGSMTGWLRALSGGTSGSGSWDGFISLSGSGYGVSMSNGVFSGYAWGDMNVGWVDFSDARTTFNDTCTPTYTCSGSTIQYTNTNCQVSNVTTCVSPQFCSTGSSQCLAPAPSFNSSTGPSGAQYTGHLQLIPTLVRSGESTQVDWNVSNAQSCTVTGTNGDSWSGLSGTDASRPITSQTTYTLSCLAFPGNNNVTETQTVETTPVYEER